MHTVTSQQLRRRTAALIVAFAAVAMAACTAGGAEEAFRPIAVGEPVPELTVRTLSGDSARMSPNTVISFDTTFDFP